jgi:hypothetical protein
MQYPEEFAAFWDAITSPRTKGLKSEALQRWEQRGKPSAPLLVRKWNEYLASLGDTSPKDVCRWIAYRGFEEIYEAAPAARRPATRIDRRRQEHEQVDNEVFEFAEGK